VQPVNEKKIRSTGEPMEREAKAKKEPGDF